MKVLGIESSSLVASVALVTDDILTGARAPLPVFVLAQLLQKDWDWH